MRPRNVCRAAKRSAGELTPAEAAELSRVVENYTRVLAYADFEARLLRSRRLPYVVARRLLAACLLLAFLLVILRTA